jgi:transcription elongation factor GreA
MPAIQLTKDGFVTLENELKELIKVALPAIKQRMASARADGDLSENNAWIMAKEEMEITRMRISDLKHMLKTATLVTAPSAKGTTIQIGNKVTLKINNMPEITVTLVPTLEADPLLSKLSLESPIGQAILGKKVGDTVKYTTPGGEQTIEIIKMQ